MKNKFPESLHFKGVGRNLSELMFWGEMPEGEVYEKIDMSDWIPPVVTEMMAYEVFNRPWLKRYMFQHYETGSEISGFWGDLWDSIKRTSSNVWSWVGEHKWIVIPAVTGAAVYATSKEARKHPGWVLGPLGIYYLGYAIRKWESNPRRNMIEPGVKKIEQKVKNPTTSKDQTLKKVASTSPILKALIESGAETAAMYLYNKMIQKSQEMGYSVQQTTDAVAAYTAKWAPEFAKMGMTPEMAGAAVLAATGGAPPDPDIDPWTLLGLKKPEYTGGEIQKKEKTFSEILHDYWWAFAAGAFLLLRSSKK